MTKTQTNLVEELNLSEVLGMVPGTGVAVLSLPGVALVSTHVTLFGVTVTTGVTFLSGPRELRTSVTFGFGTLGRRSLRGDRSLVSTVLTTSLN